MFCYADIPSDTLSTTLVDSAPYFIIIKEKPLCQDIPGFFTVFGFEGWIASVPDLCILFTFTSLKQVKVIEKQCTGTGAIKRQIPLLKPKREINKYYK